MRVAVVNYSVIDSKPKYNLAKFETILKGVSREIDLILLPELWSSGYILEDWEKISREANLVTEKISEIAKKRNIAIGFSTLYRENSKLYNRFFLFSGEGKKLIQYDKSHLFKPMREEQLLESGEKLGEIISFKEFQISSAICYDLRFPEMFRNLALLGSNLFLVSAEWPKPRCDTFLTLAKARAIENQAFLILSNRVGIDKFGVEFCGNSGVIFPDGRFFEAVGIDEVFEIEIFASELTKSKKFIQPLSERKAGIDF
jgi:predicted amidohydrolase